MIDKETVDKILDAADIVDVVSDFVHLRRRGSNYVGLCPFHNEKTPSFSVSRSKGICKCFSCGKGGSPVNFIMEHEQMSYYEALKYLAKKYNIEVKERELTDEEKQAQSERENMLLVNDFALKNFEDNLFNTDEGRSVGLSYFYEREFTDSTIKKFHLGYSMEGRSELYNAIKKNGYNPTYAIESGLCIKGEHGVYDRFKGRVMFPVLNIAGKVIAFGGRTLKKDPAKYVNSPESIIYKKKNELYGLYQAKQAIVKKDKCFLVEGYTDVLSMHQAGIENVVASSGTSLTEGQIRLIHRFTDNITVLYDGDSAGIKASLRGIDLLLAEGLNVKVLLLPDGDDPDSFAKKHNASEFQGFIDANETDFIKFKTSILLEGLENDPIKKSEAIQDIVKSISVIPENITRAVYIKECSKRFEIDEKILAEEVKKTSKGIKAKDRSGKSTTEPETTSSLTVRTEPSDAATVKSKSLRMYETDIIRYIAKYGMCNELFEIENPDGGFSNVTLVEAVNVELTSESISFSVPAFKKIFDRALSFLPDFYADLPGEADRLDKEMREKVQIAQLSDTVVGKAKERLVESIQKDFKNKLIDFEKEYLEKRLCSDQDDEIRQTTLDLVIEKEPLSKVHTRLSDMESEYDRLRDLVSLSLNVWKDALLSQRIKEIQEEIKLLCQASGDINRVEQLMQELSQLRAIRKQLIGDRVIIP